MTITPVSGINSLSMGVDPSMRKFIGYEYGVNLMLAKQVGMELDHPDSGRHSPVWTSAEPGDLADERQAPHQLL